MPETHELTLNIRRYDPEKKTSWVAKYQVKDFHGPLIGHER